jgi:hypothetical protein
VRGLLAQDLAALTKIVECIYDDEKENTEEIKIGCVYQYTYCDYKE